MIYSHKNYIFSSNWTLYTSNWTFSKKGRFTDHIEFFILNWSLYFFLRPRLIWSGNCQNCVRKPFIIWEYCSYLQLIQYFEDLATLFPLLPSPIITPSWHKLNPPLIHLPPHTHAAHTNTTLERARARQMRIITSVCNTLPFFQITHTRRRRRARHIFAAMSTRRHRPDGTRAQKSE